MGAALAVFKDVSRLGRGHSVSWEATPGAGFPASLDSTTHVARQLQWAVGYGVNHEDCSQACLGRRPVARAVFYLHWC